MVLKRPFLLSIFFVLTCCFCYALDFSAQDVMDRFSSQVLESRQNDYLPEAEDVRGNILPDSAIANFEKDYSDVGSRQIYSYSQDKVLDDPDQGVYRTEQMDPNYKFAKPRNNPVKEDPLDYKKYEGPRQEPKEEYLSNETVAESETEGGNYE